jgi:hypothetical protein
MTVAGCLLGGKSRDVNHVCSYIQIQCTEARTYKDKQAIECKNIKACLLLVHKTVMLLNVFINTNHHSYNNGTVNG